MKSRWLLLIGLFVVAAAIVIVFVRGNDVGSPRFFKDQAYYYETLRALSR